MGCNLELRDRSQACTAIQRGGGTAAKLGGVCCSPFFLRQVVWVGGSETLFIQAATGEHLPKLPSLVIC